ncbi:hypothetical protein ACFZBU_42085 [Embleya sp. NPDC008237]|uniref:hypothetical protein n=1 Tax=Embleya sp. NPDC008237 TaxID=3363978 RepID=UPI0036F0FE0E
MTGRKRPLVGSCGHCASWGVVTRTGLCPGCARAHSTADRGINGKRHDRCRRCGHPQPVARDGTCRACLLAVRLGQDKAWMWAEVRREYLPPGRPLQLALGPEGLRLPDASPLRRHDRPMVVLKIPPWVRQVCPSPVRDDPRVCPPQMPGQLALFPTPPRRFTAHDAVRIHDRDIPDLDTVFTELARIAAERGVTGATWSPTMRSMARLALAAREPGERTVRREVLPQLPQMHPTIGVALERTGLLAPRRMRLVAPGSSRHGSCEHCLSWANDRVRICARCWHWAHIHPRVGACDRCRRPLPLADGLCRFCTLVLAETEVDVSGIALDGGDQLWFGREATSYLRTIDARYPGTRRKGRFESRRRLARAAAQAARPISAHLVDPGQTQLFPTPPRNWARLDEAVLPAPTPEAGAVIDDFANYIRERGWTASRVGGSIRTLRLLVCHLGVDAPIHERDVNAVARVSPSHQGPRVVDYLRRRCLLAPEPHVDPHLAAARAVADELPKSFGDAVHTWIDALTGQGHRPGTPRAPRTVRRNVGVVAPLLREWHDNGIANPREVTTTHIEQALDVIRDARARTVHVGLRSLFRALRRERAVFRDPTRTVTLHRARRLPVPLPTDRLRGLLDQVPAARDRLVVALVAIHALWPGEVARLRLDDLERARGRLRVRRPGRPDHVVYLDELTTALAGAWIAHRYERWPQCANPHLIVSNRSAVDDLHPAVGRDVVRTPFRAVGVTAESLRQDRILDEARHTADPIGLMRVFGLSDDTALRYVAAAHPDKRPDPITA